MGEQGPAGAIAAIELSKEPDFAIGAIRIEPSRRRIDGGVWSKIIEPRVMQALVALVRAEGDVVSRDDLIRLCWRGRIVGDDAINGCVGKVRQLGQEGDEPFFRIETVPRVGYRLVRSDAVRAPEPSRDPPLPDKPSLAVLPFQNLSGDSDKEYFADAITEDIITALSRWRWFFVISRNSSFYYKGQTVDAQKVGRELGVRYLLEGSAQRSATRVRITAELIEAESRTHVWTEKFDRSVSDIFLLQDEITEHLAAAIEPEMRLSEGARAARKPFSDLTAIDCYQRGMWFLHKITRDNYGDALALFRQAIERDAGLSLGHTGLARVLYGGVISGWARDPVAELEEARGAAEEAVQLDERDACAHFALAGALLYLGRHNEALAEAETSVALNPNFAFAQFRLGQVLIYAGRSREAIAPIERSIRHSPFDPQLGSMRGALALACYHSGDFEAGAREARLALALKHQRSVPVLAANLWRLGRRSEAHDVLTLSRPSSREMLKPSMQMPYANDAELAQLREDIRKAQSARGKRRR